MIEFVRGQTTRIWCEIKEADVSDLSTITSMNMVIKQNGLVKIDKKTEDCYIGGRKVFINLSQQETMKFQESKAEDGNTEIQLSIMISNKRMITKTCKDITVDRLLKEGVQT